VDRELPETKLSRIQTLWTVVAQAHQGPTVEVSAAQTKLLERYGKAVHRYLLGALRDADAAEELAQEFALRFLRGDLHGVDRDRGRFRDFVKGVLFHMIADYHRRRRRSLQALPLEVPEPATTKAENDADQQFVESWRAELLDRAWKALGLHQEQAGQAFHTVLRFRAEHPDLNSPGMAEALADRLGRPVTPGWIRQVLLRAREVFVDLLLAEVARSLSFPTREALEDELIALDLRDYCKPGLDRFAGA